MFTRLAAPLLLVAGCAGLASPSQAQPAAFGGPKILIHGNYCGPGNNAPLPPIDALDAACARIRMRKSCFTGSREYFDLPVAR